MIKKYFTTRRFFSLIAGLVFLSACVNVEEKIFLNLDGSGRMEIRYIMKREFFQLVPQGTGTRFPTSEADVYKMFKDVKGVKVEGAKLEEDESNVSLKYILSFDNISSFNTESYQFSFTDAGNEKNFHVFVRGGGAQKKFDSGPLRQKVMSEAVNQAMSIYNIKITVVFPSPILKSNAREVQDRTATWVIPIWDLQRSDGFDLDAKIKVQKGIWERIKGIF